MNTEQEALKLVDSALNSIETVMKDWKKLDAKRKNTFSQKVDSLRDWKEKLESWRHSFLETDKDERYPLLIELHHIMQQG